MGYESEDSVQSNAHHHDDIRSIQPHEMNGTAQHGAQPTITSVITVINATPTEIFEPIAPSQPTSASVISKSQTLPSNKWSKRERAEQKLIEDEERKRIELANKKKMAATTKKMLEEDLDNFQYDQWKKHCIAQTFSLPTLESASKK